jgi:ABC-type lipoprotein release transport system permease subunit
MSVPATSRGATVAKPYHTVFLQGSEAILTRISHNPDALTPAEIGSTVTTLLYRLQPRDPMTLVAAVAVLGAIGALAGWLPARRASRIDPARVLREG